MHGRAGTTACIKSKRLDLMEVHSYACSVHMSLKEVTMPECGFGWVLGALYAQRAFVDCILTLGYLFIMEL